MFGLLSPKRFVVVQIRWNNAKILHIYFPGRKTYQIAMYSKYFMFKLAFLILIHILLQMQKFYSFVSFNRFVVLFFHKISSPTPRYM